MTYFNLSFSLTREHADSAVEQNQIHWLQCVLMYTTI